MELVAPAFEDAPLDELRAVVFGPGAVPGAATTVQLMLKDSQRYAATEAEGRALRRRPAGRREPSRYSLPTIAEDAAQPVRSQTIVKVQLKSHDGPRWSIILRLERR